jgi:hypothetical protein
MLSVLRPVIVIGAFIAGIYDFDDIYSVYISAVLITTRKEPRDEQQRRISTFGRGAHGRLGNGKCLERLGLLECIYRLVPYQQARTRLPRSLC